MVFLDLVEVEEREMAPGFRARMVHSDNMTIAFWQIDVGAALPAHSHPHEQVFTLLEGEFELTVGDEKRVNKPGAVVVIPSNVPHAGRALTNREDTH